MLRGQTSPARSFQRLLAVHCDGAMLSRRPPRRTKFRRQPADLGETGGDEPPRRAASSPNSPNRHWFDATVHRWGVIASVPLRWGRDRPRPTPIPEQSVPPRSTVRSAIVNLAKRSSRGPRAQGSQPGANALVMQAANRCCGSIRSRYAKRLLRLDLRAPKVRWTTSVRRGGAATSPTRSVAKTQQREALWSAARLPDQRAEFSNFVAWIRMMRRDSVCPTLRRARR